MVIEESSLNTAMIVEALSGNAVLQNANGGRILLTQGDQLQFGDLVLAEPGSMVDVSLPNGAALQLGGASAQALVIDRAVLDMTSTENCTVDLTSIHELLLICGGMDEFSSAGLLSNPVLNVTG